MTEDATIQAPPLESLRGGMVEGPFAAPALTSAQVLQSAAQHFAERGFEAPSMAELCDATGASVEFIEAHFGGLDGLIQAVVNLLQVGFRQMCGEHDNNTAPSIDSLVEFVVTFFEVAEQQPWVIKLLSRFPTVHPRHLEGIQHPREAEAILTTYVERAAKSAGVTVDAEAATWLLVGGFTRMAMLRSRFDFPDSLRDMASRLVYQSLGLRPPPRH